MKVMNLQGIPKKNWYIILGIVSAIVWIIWFLLQINSSNGDKITTNSQKWNNNIIINKALSGSNINIDNKTINYSESNNINDIRATRYSPKSWILKYTNDSNINIKDLRWYIYFRKENWGVVEMQNIDLWNINSNDQKELSLFCNPKLPMIVWIPWYLYKELEIVCFEYQDNGNYYCQAPKKLDTNYLNKNTELRV